MDEQEDIAFGPFRLDRHSRTLTRDGAPVALHGRALDVLSVLAAAGGALVSKDALLRAAWAGVTVDENNLHQQINALRKALGASAFVTVPGRGYRLAVVSPDADRATDGDRRGGRPTVAVLPFACLAGDAGLQFFTAGIAGEITTALARVRSLVMVVPQSSFGFDRGSVAPAQVARRVDARYLLDGSVRGGASQVRVVVRLVDAATGVHLWADRFDGALEDDFSLQDRVTARVVAAIAPRLVIAEIERVQRQAAAPSHPYDLLLRGLAQYAVGSRPGMEAAIRLLRRAIELGPGYALAHAHLASIQWLMVAQQWQTVDDPIVADLPANVQSALALAGDDPEILLLVSPLLATRANDLDGAIDTVYRSLAAHPHNAAALRMLGVLHAYAGDVDVAFDSLARADRLNPFDHGVTNNLGYLIAQFCAGDHESVARTSARLLTVQPRFAPILRWRAASLGLLGRIDESRAVMRRIVELSPGFSLGSARKFNEYDQSNLMRLPHVQSAFYEGLRRAGAPEG